MKHFIARMITQLAPPIVLAMYRKFATRRLFSGTYQSWEAARAASAGYDAKDVLRRVRESAIEVRNGRAIYERDGVLFESIEYAWPLLAGLMWVAAQRGGRLRVLDFGGALGTTYFQNRKFLRDLAEVRWNIVEQPSFVAVGNAEFADERLLFFGTLKECVEQQRCDVLVISGVLQYLPDPGAILSEALRHAFDFVLIDKTPLLEDAPKRLTIQHVPESIYPGSYPAWFLSRSDLLSHFRESYDLIEEFDWGDSVDLSDVRATHRGFMFRRRRSA